MIELNRKQLLREVLELGYEDDVLETDDERVFIVERKKAPGLYGFCNSIPEDAMEVFLVLNVSEVEREGLSDKVPDYKIGEYSIFRE
ncbi:MAG: hypothetical protein JW825_04605 [Candidatus Methanofastidiosa archaeon]|nr:hypothetical protein [Candidatus Methanofastidiosa archaeon]